MNGERLGHLIRRLRIKQPTEIAKADLLRLLDTADLGLYWSIAAPMEMDAYSKKTQEAMTRAAGIQRERDTLRKAYKVDVEKINAAGFDNLDTLIAGQPRHEVQGIKGFACWLATVFDGDAGLDEVHWLQRAEEYLNQGRTNDLPF